MSSVVTRVVHHAGMDVGVSGAQGEDGREGEELAEGDVKAEVEEGEEEPPARRPRHQDWDGGTTPPVWCAKDTQSETLCSIMN